MYVVQQGIDFMPHESNMIYIVYDNSINAQWSQQNWHILLQMCHVPKIGRKYIY
jgi:arginyl-tRNA--protein-N-Asp/Glu arginylyltransferase